VKNLPGLFLETPDGIYVPDADVHIDPWRPVARALITHAHGDHARPGSKAYLATPDTAALIRTRFGPETQVETIEYGQPLTAGGVRITLYPAGHVLGSAQVLLETAAGRTVFGGDYKRAPDPTCRPFEPVPCDTFVTEATFGLPIYRWDSPHDVVRAIFDWWTTAAERGDECLLFCYTLGKAQRILAELARLTDRPVYAHGAMLPITAVYRTAGVEMLPLLPLAAVPRKQSLAGELVLAPVSARGTPWMRRFRSPSTAFASGLMRVRGVRRQRGYDRGFVLSDHADWPALLETVRDSGASSVIATHGHSEPLARYFAEQGLQSTVIRTAFEGESGSAAGEVEAS
jgi:putative mRNA 3-end processing factor